LSAAKSDWVDANRSYIRSASEARSAGQERQSRKGLEYAGGLQKTREQSGRPMRSAGKGRKVAEASRMRLEAVEEVVDAEEAREAN